MMHSWTKLVLIILFFCGPSICGGQTSRLWGRNGELYKTGLGGRLLDWSYAGYMAGERGIPRLSGTANIRNFGAKGDGRTDDTAAFLRAFSRVRSGVLYFPPGRYVIKSWLNVTGRLSLLGAGSGQTVFVYPVSLGALYGNRGSHNVRTAQDGDLTASAWSFGGGFINYNAGEFYNPGTFLAFIKSDSARGARTIKVDRAVRNVRPGQWVSISIGNTGSRRLFPDMNRGVDKGCTVDERCFRKNLFSFESRVESVPDRYTVVLERPLPWNVSTAFSPASLHRWQPGISNIGIQGITFLMQSKRYEGHFREAGWNAIQMYNVSNSWVRDIEFIGADNGLMLTGCSFITATNIRFSAPAPRAGPRRWTGHHGFMFTYTSDTLISNFDFGVQFVHDISIDYMCHGIVVSQGKGVDLNMDHHRAQNYGTLWTQIDVGAGTRVWESGGTPYKGLHAGTFTTFWGIYRQRGARFGARLPGNFGPWLNLIGCGYDTAFPSQSSPITRTWWIERIKPSDLQPANLFLAQRALRLSSRGKVSRILGGLGNGGQTPP